MIRLHDCFVIANETTDNCQEKSNTLYIIYSKGEFQALQLIVFASFCAVD